MGTTASLTQSSIPHSSPPVIMVSFTVYKGSENGAVVAATTEKPELQNDQVLVKVTASGLCGTDLHYKNANMGLGHEGVGVIESVGPQVKYMKKGDRVGWGYEHNSCEHCQQCLRGNETYCPERKMYGLADLDQGSMATHAVWREAFLFQIPTALATRMLPLSSAVVLPSLTPSTNSTPSPPRPSVCWALAVSATLLSSTPLRWAAVSSSSL